MLKNLLTIIASIACCLLLLEGGLRLLPVNEGLLTQPVDEAHPIAHFKPNRTSTWSRFADFSMVNTVHSNNYGFLNDQDYDPKGRLPLLAVIGDSYVEAAMIPYQETVQGRLARELEQQWRVYSFGMSGAPLSQYLAYARYARDEFHPARMVFVIVGNDFDESLLKYKSSGGFHYFAEDGTGTLDLVRTDYHPSLPVRVLRHSMLARYMVTNAQMQTLLHRIQSLDKKAEQFVGQTAAQVSRQRRDDSLKAIDEFLRLAPAYSGLPPKDIILLLDGMRPHLYAADTLKKAEGSFVDQMRNHLSKEAVRLGFSLIDMQPRFMAHYDTHGQPFEFPKDGHWNNLGHQVAAEAVIQSGLIR
ncbi:hypothetical protein [Salidesulfovibrio onnuriiensis]|uniref:hypothetical protein n=1 Tax=Salidesulfovibrio onnuriiensis TaxID=2583823 RepID=UPI0011C75171|nr:hypothetical protein [Salidesulfovibrio onnuriiensis]